MSPSDFGIQTVQRLNATRPNFQSVYFWVDPICNQSHFCNDHLHFGLTHFATGCILEVVAIRSCTRNKDTQVWILIECIKSSFIFVEWWIMQHMTIILHEFCSISIGASLLYIALKYNCWRWLFVSFSKQCSIKFQLKPKSYFLMKDPNENVQSVFLPKYCLMTLCVYCLKVYGHPGQ